MASLGAASALKKEEQEALALLKKGRYFEGVEVSRQGYGTFFREVGFVAGKDKPSARASAQVAESPESLAKKAHSLKKEGDAHSKENRRLSYKMYVLSSFLYVKSYMGIKDVGERVKAFKSLLHFLETCLGLPDTEDELKRPLSLIINNIYYHTLTLEIEALPSSPQAYSALKGFTSSIVSLIKTSGTRIMDISLLEPYVLSNLFHIFNANCSP